MYREAYEKITDGLGLIPRLILAFFSFLLALPMLLIASNPDAPIFYLGIGAFCALIGFSCITKGRVRQFLGSTIGLIVFLLAVWYLVSQLSFDRSLPLSKNEPSLLNAILFFFVFGLPGAAYSLSVRFGFSSKDSR